MTELCLADLVPLWRTLREADVTALVTPALDYVGGLELVPLDVRFAGEDEVSLLGKGLRRLISSLDDECTLHFLYRVTSDAEGAVRSYEESARAEGAALREYVEARARWLRA